MECGITITHDGSKRRSHAIHSHIETREKRTDHASERRKVLIEDLLLLKNGVDYVYAPVILVNTKENQRVFFEMGTRMQWNQMSIQRQYSYFQRWINPNVLHLLTERISRSTGGSKKRDIAEIQYHSAYIATRRRSTTR